MGRCRQPAAVDRTPARPHGAAIFPQQQPQICDTIVAANRVSSDARKTPVAISVYDAQALADAGVRSIASLSTIDPSIDITQSTGAAYVATRGVASTGVTEIGGPSVPGLSPAARPGHLHEALSARLPRPLRAAGRTGGGRDGRDAAPRPYTIPKRLSDYAP